MKQQTTEVAAAADKGSQQPPEVAAAAPKGLQQPFKGSKRPSVPAVAQQPLVGLTTDQRRISHTNKTKYVGR